MSITKEWLQRSPENDVFQHADVVGRKWIGRFASLTSDTPPLWRITTQTLA